MTSFYPAASIRTSTPLAATRMLFQVNNDQTAIQRLQMQLSTGLRFQKPSESPSNAVKVLASQRQQEFRNQTQVNLKQADSLLSVTESNLSETQNLLNQIRATSVEAANNTLSDDQRTALLNEVDGILRRLTDLANAKFGDQYIFAGSNVRSDPVKFNTNTVQFSGDSQKLNTISDYNTLVTANVSAQEAFGVVSDQVVGTVDLDPAISSETPLSILNHGNGIRKGAISISSGTDAIELDLSNVHNLGEVVDKISSTSIGGRQLSATLSVNGIDIEYEDGLGGILRIDNVGSGATATDLGINNVDTGSASPVIGSDLDPLLTLTTNLTQLLTGSGLPLGSSFSMTQGGTRYVVNTNGINTVEDLLNRIERTGASVNATIDPSGRYLSIQSTESGTQLSIGENGDDLATQLGIRTLTAETPISRLNNGQGIFLNSNGGADLIFTRNDGSEFSVSLEGVQSVQDVLDQINNNVNNLSPTAHIEARLSAYGNGIELVSAPGTQPISVSNAGGSQAATGLGWTNKSNPIATGEDDGTDVIISGQDVSGVEVSGIFSSVIKLRNAIANQDFDSMESIGASVDHDLERLSIARGFVGSRQQDIASRLQKSEDDVIQLKQIESDNIDVDLASAITELTQRQAAMQASLQLLGQTARTTLFDYL